MDPLEQIIADALDSVGASYTTDFGGGNSSGLDFRLSSGVEIEVKRFHTPRIAEQTSRAPNVIVAQGEGAVRLLAFLIRTSAVAKDESPLAIISRNMTVTLGENYRPYAPASVDTHAERQDAEERLGPKDE